MATHGPIFIRARPILSCSQPNSTDPPVLSLSLSSLSLSSLSLSLFLGKRSVQGYYDSLVFNLLACARARVCRRCRPDYTSKLLLFSSTVPCGARGLRNAIGTRRSREATCAMHLVFRSVRMHSKTVEPESRVRERYYPRERMEI